jgi:hypothetical protein
MPYTVKFKLVDVAAEALAGAAPTLFVQEPGELGVAPW